MRRIKDRFAIVVFVFVLSAAIAAQTESNPNNVVVWGPGRSCSPANVAFVKAAFPKCERVKIDRGTFYIVEYKGLSVALSYAALLGHIRAMTQITNRSGQTVDFNPLLSTIDVFSNQSAYLKGKTRRGISNSITADAAKAVYLKEEAKYTVVDPFLSPSTTSDGSQPPTPTVTYTEKNGRLTNVTSGVPNSPKRPEETRIVLSDPVAPSVVVSTPRPSSPSHSTLDRFNYGIKIGIIAEQEKAAGYIFFESVKDAPRYLVFRIKVGNLVFVFPDETLEDIKKLPKKT
jgi:hypothetical protein